MRIKVLKSKPKISGETIVESIENYLQKSFYPKTLVTKKIDLMIEKYNTLQKNIDETANKGMEKLNSLKTKANDLKMKNAEHTGRIMNKLSRSL